MLSRPTTYSKYRRMRLPNFVGSSRWRIHSFTPSSFARSFVCRGSNVWNLSWTKKALQGARGINQACTQDVTNSGKDARCTQKCPLTLVVPPRVSRFSHELDKLLYHAVEFCDKGHEAGVGVHDMITFAVVLFLCQWRRDETTGAESDQNGNTNVHENTK